MMSTITYYYTYTSLRRWWKLIEDWKMRKICEKYVKIWRYKDAQCQSINVKIKSSMSINVNGGIMCRGWDAEEATEKAPEIS